MEAKELRMYAVFSEHGSDFTQRSRWFDEKQKALEYLQEIKIVRKGEFVILEKTKPKKLQEIKMLQDKLENEMYAHISQTGNDINLIVMHPLTWENLAKEVIGKDSMAIYRHNPSLMYKGILVLRSLDLLEDEFLMTIT